MPRKCGDFEKPIHSESNPDGNLTESKWNWTTGRKNNIFTFSTFVVNRLKAKPHTNRGEVRGLTVSNNSLPLLPIGHYRPSKAVAAEYTNGPGVRDANHEQQHSQFASSWGPFLHVISYHSLPSFPVISLL